MVLPTLPSNEEIIFAVSDPPLGEGQEARVFKVHTNPHFTVRQSIELPNDKVFQYLSDSQLIMQPDIFGGRNFAQTVAYFRHPAEAEDAAPLITINRYVPGFSYEIERSGGMKLNSEEALIKTKVMTQKILEVPNKAMDILYNDLIFRPKSTLLMLAAVCLLIWETFYILPTINDCSLLICSLLLMGRGLI